MNKKIIITILLLFSLLFFVNNSKQTNAFTINLTSPSTTGFVTPVGDLSGSSMLLNASFIMATGEKVNITNVTFYLIAPNGTKFLIGINSSKNGTQSVGNLAGGLSFTLLFDTTAFPDNWNYTINVTAYNTTSVLVAINQTQTNPGFDIDNTNPTSTYGSSTPANAGTIYTGSATIDSAIDSSLELNNCTLYWTAPGTAQTTETLRVSTTNSLCTTTKTFSESGTYSYYLTSTDGADTSTFSTQTFNYDTGGVIISGGSSGGGTEPLTTGQALSVTPTTIQTKSKIDGKTILIVAGALILLYLFFFRKGKKGKKNRW